VHKDLALGSNAKRVKILGASLFNVLELTHCLSHAQISIPENQNITWFLTFCWLICQSIIS